MYVENVRRYYTADGEQRVGRGRFLMLLQSDSLPIGPNNMRGLIRKVALRQLGQWMMGFARIKGKRYTVSGTYGDDGLPMTVPHDIFMLGVPVPAELYQAWNKGGGWNGAGSEAYRLQEWGKTLPGGKL